MKSIVLLFFGILGVHETICLDLVSSRLQVEATNYNFGVIAPQIAVSNAFRIVNNGNLDVKILKVSKSCSCIVEAFKTNVIPVKGKTNLIIQFFPKERVGFFHEQIVLETDSKYNPVTVFNITGWISPPSGMTCDPNVIDFGYIVSTNRYVCNIKITGTEEALNKISIEPLAEWLKIKRGVKEKVDGFNHLMMASYDINLNATATNLYSCRTYIDFHSNNSVLRIPVEWSTSEKIRVSPHIMLFGFIKKGLRSEQVIKISGNNLLHLKLEDARLELSKLYYDNKEDMDVYRCIFYNNEAKANRKISGSIDVIQKWSGKKVDLIEYHAYLLDTFP